MEDYQSKYLKYKMKYLTLKAQIGGTSKEELDAYLRQVESAKRREQSPSPPLPKEPEPVNPRDEALEQAALEQQLRELDLSPPLSPTYLQEKLAPEKYVEMQRLFDQSKQERPERKKSSKPSKYTIQTMSPEEQDIIQRQLAELDDLSKSAPIKQTAAPSTQLSASAPIVNSRY